MRLPYSLGLALAAAAVVLVLTPLVGTLARRLGALDQPGPRRIHASPVPRLGGLAIAAAVLGVAWIAYMLPGGAHSFHHAPLTGLTLASLPLLLLGMVDDVRGAPPLAKLVAQVLAALILVGHGYGIPVLANPFGEPIASGPLDVPLTVAWVLIVTNAINLIDGLDGLAAGVAVIAAMTLWWVGRTHGDHWVMFLSAPLAGAAFGFLRHNFPPARIFMGDTGSQFLGLVLAAISLIENRKGTTAIALLFPLVAMGVPILDGGLAFLRRLVSRRPVFRADSEHIHHRLLRIGLSRRAALLLLWCLCGYLGVMALFLEAMPRQYTWILIAVLAAGLVLAFEVLGFVNRRISERRRRGPDEPER